MRRRWVREFVVCSLLLLGFLAVLGWCNVGCTHREMLDAVQVAREVNDCTLLNRDPRARDACLAGIALAVAEQELRRRTDAGDEQ